ncbi:hypothetical protein SRB5_05830 [Streptomyces sp. RB5]|uniref:Carbon monoxide dehydrogenase subunit G n=1 Tax=Streptomyces smaragdinus TaxID=2585196 RepID=A0A7K0CAK4_9ACTN|nr:SRPBCC family protein [Streptomyces smaragdinus]MQY10475.1 hypothetical protein [Streptomyces smaragdinus]
MELQHEFTVPVPADQAWEVLLDIERIAPCMPGATVESYDGETVGGAVKVKVGPITVTYRGTAVFEERDEKIRRMVLAASGRETRGQGTARARVTGQLTERDDGGTQVSVITDLTITGRPAQFGRSLMADVGERLIGQFAGCLAERLAEREREDPVPPLIPADEPLDLLRTAGAPVARRAGWPAAVAAALVLVFAAARRRRRRKVRGRST